MPRPGGSCIGNFLASLPPVHVPSKFLCSRDRLPTGGRVYRPACGGCAPFSKHPKPFVGILMEEDGLLGLRDWGSRLTSRDEALLALVYPVALLRDGGGSVSQQASIYWLRGILGRRLAGIAALV
ncbi:hypothetical protein TARUN_1762 [Trichoderma arundinaceum]|uniref:Uncharacterized protein n=1 Tax=Trichoderma arundinaceum TaxID=490622 RepID=A0A395NWK0_TRIAR|nr:hypothetical protein TARUN_1762 [Trichoderma arundinaceum]